MDTDTSQMFTQLLAVLRSKQVLKDVEIKQLFTDAMTRVDTEQEKQAILAVRSRIFPDEYRHK